jgi:hypothetical protein
MLIKIGRLISGSALQQAGMPSAQLSNLQEKSSTARQRERNHATILQRLRASLNLRMF